MRDALLSPLALGNRLCRVCSLSLGGFPLVAAGLCEEAGGSLQVGRLLWRHRTTEGADQSQSKRQEHQRLGIPIYQCACLCGVLVKEAQLSADFHMDFSIISPKWQATASFAL